MTKITCIATIRAALADGLARHGDRSRRRRELDDTSDRALAEMGLSRGDVGAVADGRHRR